MADKSVIESTCIRLEDDEAQYVDIERVSDGKETGSGMVQFQKLPGVYRKNSDGTETFIDMRDINRYK